jgi:hypothetical protein
MIRYVQGSPSGALYSQGDWEPTRIRSVKVASYHGTCAAWAASVNPCSTSKCGFDGSKECSESGIQQRGADTSKLTPRDLVGAPLQHANQRAAAGGEKVRPGQRFDLRILVEQIDIA